MRDSAQPGRLAALGAGDPRSPCVWGPGQRNPYWHPAVRLVPCCGTSALTVATSWAVQFLQCKATQWAALSLCSEAWQGATHLLDLEYGIRYVCEEYKAHKPKSIKECSTCGILPLEDRHAPEACTVSRL